MKKHILLYCLTVLSTIWAYGQQGVGIDTDKPQGIFHIDTGKNNAANPPTAEQMADDVIVDRNGNVGTGAIPDKSAILELNVARLAAGSKKGVLFPQVSLTGIQDVSTIASPANGMLVYNKGTAGLAFKGYVYWEAVSGRWKAIDGRDLTQGTFTGLGCAAARLEPANYIKNVPYAGVLKVPYSGSNGGWIPGETVGPVNGLTIRRGAEYTTPGEGFLTYTVSGMPTVSSPVTTSFNIAVGGKSCTPVVGNAEDMAVGELRTFQKTIQVSNFPAKATNGYTSSDPNYWISTYLSLGISNLPIIDGKLRVDGYVYGTPFGGPGGVSFEPRLVNVTDDNQKIWLSALSNVSQYGQGNLLLAPGRWIELDNGIYMNYGFNDTTSPQATIGGSTINGQEVESVDIKLNNKWFRIYYFCYVNNMGTSSTADDEFVVNLSIVRFS